MLFSLGSASRRLALLIAPLVAVVVALLLLVAACMETLSAGRAFVGGEGLWSKAQKDAVVHLLRYARSFEDGDYQEYLAAIAVTLGDRKARLALDRPDPDYAAARQGFIEGRNHPDDVDAMAKLFVRFRHVSYVDRAIAIWADGDHGIDRLQEAAGRLRGEIQGARDPARIRAILAEVHAAHEALQPLEDAFSFTLGEASRWMQDALFLALLAAAVLLLGMATLRTRALLRRADAAEAARRESDERLQMIANSVPALISYVDRDMRYRFSNRTYEEWFGFQHRDMLGRTVGEVFGGGPYQYESVLRPNAERALRGERVEFEYAHGEGETARYLQVSYLPHRGPDGGVEGFYSLSADITALKRAQLQQSRAVNELAQLSEQFAFLARHDTLTGLPNRAMLQDRVAQAVSFARRHGKGVGLLFVDLDHFKRVNDGHGHATGDALLRAVAARLRESVRQEDMVARLGGDEFCVLLQDIGAAEDAGAVAEKLLAALSGPYRIDGLSLQVGASIGVACLPQDAEDMDTLLRHADVAMYRAKGAGRGSVRFFSGGVPPRPGLAA